MNDDLARLLAALDRPSEPLPAPARPKSTGPARRGRPPALTRLEVLSIRRRRARPLAERPRVAELAAEFGVDVVTVRKALRASPPYDFGDPLPQAGGPHRDRGSGRFWPDP